MRIIGTMCRVMTGALVLASAGTAWAGQDETTQKMRIAVLLEEGYASPRIEVGDAALSGMFELTITGNARFADAGAVEATRTTVAMAGALIVPAIKPAFIYDESFVRGAGVPEVRVVTLPSGGIERLAAALDASPGALLQVGRHYAVVDEARVQPGTAGAIVNVDQGFGNSAQPDELCVRQAWGPGWVNWHFSNPAGAGYSVKPECCTSLVWASGSGQDCDGIYRRSWGCGTALKVPDSCTADVYGDGSISCCCNATLAALGYVCQWVNPGGIGWPNCPL